MQTLRKGKKMRFEQALKAMRDGKKVTRLSDKDWKVIYWFSNNAICLQVVGLILGDEESYHIAETSFDYSDINASDWEIVQDDV